jgi:arginine/lysine/histidine transport system ATP-binding protein
MIELKNISISFDGIKILDEVSLKVKAGEVISIIGPSGSGKSTLLKCINFLEQPNTGEVFIAGQLIDEDNAREFCSRVPMVFQQFHLFPHMTVLENVSYAPVKVLGKSKTQAAKEARALLKKVGIEGKATSYPSSLSGGQKQRVAIARALAMNPEAILFDEPTSALDPEMVREVLDVIKDLAHTGITIMIVTHVMSFANEISDRVIFLDQGKILEDSEPKQFFKKPKSKRAHKFLDKLL